MYVALCRCARRIIALPLHNHHHELIMPPFVWDHTQKIKHPCRLLSLFFFSFITPLPGQPLPDTILHVLQTSWVYSSAPWTSELNHASGSGYREEIIINYSARASRRCVRRDCRSRIIVVFPVSHYPLTGTAAASSAAARTWNDIVVIVIIIINHIITYYYKCQESRVATSSAVENPRC